jgi:hypothetical protein
MKEYYSKVERNVLPFSKRKYNYQAGRKSFADYCRGYKDDIIRF